MLAIHADPSQNCDDQDARPPIYNPLDFGACSAKEEQERKLDSPRTGVEENIDGQDSTEKDFISDDESQTGEFSSGLDGVFFIQGGRLYLPEDSTC